MLVFNVPIRELGVIRHGCSFVGGRMKSTLVQILAILTVTLASTMALGNDQKLSDFDKEILADFADDMRKDDVKRLNNEANLMMQNIAFDGEKDQKGQTIRKEQKDDDMQVTVRLVKRAKRKS
jgi:hypothetical protein